MSNTTFITRGDQGQIIGDRTSPTMAYTHAVVTKSAEGVQGVYSWHTTAELARQAAQGYAANANIGTAATGTTYTVFACESHPGSKAAVLKRLAKEAEAEAPAEVPAAAKAPAKQSSAGSRSIPTQAAHKARQRHLDEVGMDKYRQQYNSGWDAATAGLGAKKAGSGTATVAWMDGYTDRIANPGKEGIASKWAALRSTSAPVAKVAAKA
jgi:hypothetical protein